MKHIRVIVLLPVIAMAIAVSAAAAREDKVMQERYQRGIEEIQKLGEARAWEKALDVLEELRDTPGMLDSAQRQSRILFALMYVHAQLGQKYKAVYCLGQLAEAGLQISRLVAQIESDPSLAMLRDAPEFRRALEKAAEERFWDNPVFETPYQENISEDEKVAGLSRFWAEVKYNFAFFHQVPDVDWDALYVAYLPKVCNTKSTLEYYRILQELCAKLDDGHTAVRMPSELHNTVSARPPIATELVEGKLIITDVFDDTLRAEGINAGLEIVEIDGVPVHDYARQQVMPYRGSSTQQARELFTYREVLWGAEGQPVRVGLRHERGATYERTLSRVAASEIKGKPWKAFEFKLLSGTIAYVALNTLDDAEVVSSFDSAFESIQQAEALIIDVRRNSGGSSSIGWQLLGRLTDKPFRGHVALVRRYAPYPRANGKDPWEVETSGGREQPPQGTKVFTEPVVVLTSAFTGSAAEDFCVAFDAMNRGAIIGEPTGGSTGQPLYIRLPGGGSACVCTVECRHPDGEEYVGVGVQPDILVRPTVADVRAGRDPVLEAALDYLQGKRAE